MSPWNLAGHETNDSISQVQLYEGDILKVTCNAEGNPTVNSLTWEQETQTSKSLSALNNPLYLYSVKLKDKGEYKCQANNTMGSAEATFYVFVTCKHIAGASQLRMRFTSQVQEVSLYTALAYGWSGQCCHTGHQAWWGRAELPPPHGGPLGRRCPPSLPLLVGSATHDARG